jgi:hypothetical protein
VFYVVRRSKPGRFRLIATLLKLVSINIEVDAQDKPDELPGNAVRHREGSLTPSYRAALLARHGTTGPSGTRLR